MKKSKWKKIVQISDEVFSSGDDPSLTECLTKANNTAHFATTLLVKYMIALYWATLLIMAAMNLMVCYFVYGEIKGELLYVPFRAM